VTKAEAAAAAAVGATHQARILITSSGSAAANAHITYYCGTNESARPPVLYVTGQRHHPNACAYTCVSIVYADESHP
jgi:hypothetical protein